MSLFSVHSENDESINENRDRKFMNKSEMILNSAMQEFTANGFVAANMDRIASAAGVSKPTIYSYFKDKEGLFDSVHTIKASLEAMTILLREGCGFSRFNSPFS